MRRSVTKRSGQVFGHVVVGALFVLFGCVLPLHDGVAPGRVALVALVGLAVGMPTSVFGDRGGLLIFFAALIIGVGAWDQTYGWALLPVWAFSMGLGALVGGDAPWAARELRHHVAGG